MNSVVVAQDPVPLPGLSAISISDIQNSAIDFVNTTSSPGLAGATLNVDSEGRSSDQWRSSLGFSGEVTLKDYIFSAYWGFALVGGSLTDSIQFIADNSDQVTLNLRRDVVSLRGSLGLSFPINDRFKLRPVLTLAVSDMKTKSSVDGLFNINNNPVTMNFENSAQLISTTGSFDALYWYWRNDYKLELSAHYNLIYTDSFSDSNPLLDTYSFSQTTLLKSRVSGPTTLTTSARPWRWQAYVNHTKFLTQDKRSLGYTGLFEIGTGLEWRFNVKPLNWFGWQYIGFSAGVITSRDVEGFNVGLTAR